MKDTKVERAQRNAAMLRRQFLHGDGGLFDQVLDDQTLATVFADHGKPGRDPARVKVVVASFMQPTVAQHWGQTTVSRRTSLRHHLKLDQPI